MKKIISIGEIVWDMLPSGRQLGGAPVNFAYYTAELGANAYPITAVGNDRSGSEMLDILKKSGLDLNYIQINNFPTGKVLVTLDGNGIPRYEIVENVAWDSIEAGEKEFGIVSDADAVCWGSLSQRSEPSRSSILSLVDSAPQNCVRVFDINIRQDYYDIETLSESLRRCNILKLNEDELPLLQKMFELPIDKAEAIRAICSVFGVSLVIFTQGARCSEVFDASSLLSHIDTPEVEVVDTVGAGDSFTAAFVTSLLDGSSVEDAHRLAVDISAWVCTCHGAINPLPEKFKSKVI